MTCTNQDCFALRREHDELRAIVQATVPILRRTEADIAVLRTRIGMLHDAIRKGKPFTINAAPGELP